MFSIKDMAEIRFAHLRFRFGYADTLQHEVDVIWHQSISTKQDTMVNSGRLWTQCTNMYLHWENNPMAIMSLIRFRLPGVENRERNEVLAFSSSSIRMAWRICAISNTTRGSRSSPPLAWYLAKILAALPSCSSGKPKNAMRKQYWRSLWRPKIVDFLEWTWACGVTRYLAITRGKEMYQIRATWASGMMACTRVGARKDHRLCSARSYAPKQT